MADQDPRTRDREPDPFARHRRPRGPATPGEDPGKRTSDEMNDPEVEPGAHQGQPRDQPAQI